MMVLASIYLYVSGSLPTTSAIKPVEVWLIFNLVYPCFIILSNVLLQVAADIHSCKFSYFEGPTEKYISSKIFFIFHVIPD